MSMREMINSLRAGVPITEQNLSLLDTHAKHQGTPEELPDREMQQHTVAPGDVRWGHHEELSNLHPFVRAHMPDATHATAVYGPKGTILHNGQSSKFVHADEPDFNHVEHYASHAIHVFGPHRTHAGHWKHLHTDNVHVQTFKRNPNETAQDFSNRIQSGIEDTKHYMHNDMHMDYDDPPEQHPLEHTQHLVVHDPLENWQEGHDREKNENIMVSYSGSLTHSHSPEPENIRHGQIAQEFSHHIRVR